MRTADQTDVESFDEVVLHEWQHQFSQYGSRPLACAFVASVPAGIKVRVRVGGALGEPDGDLVASITGVGGITNVLGGVFSPNARRPVKVTGERTSGTIQMAGGFNVAFA